MFEASVQFVCERAARVSRVKRSAHELRDLEATWEHSAVDAVLRGLRFGDMLRDVNFRP